MATPQQMAQANIAKADAVHDLGQPGRPSADDLPFCRIALGDMLVDANNPSDYVDEETSRNYMNYGLSQITGGEVTSTGGGAYSTYERHYSNVVFPDEYQTTSFQHILNSYFEWEAAGKPGERPFGWLPYTGFRNAQTKVQDLQELQAKGINIPDYPVGADQLLMAPASNFGSLVIEWDPEDTRYQEWDMYNERNQRIICDFIIKYLYPGRNTIKKGVFVFDANAGSIKELFDCLDQLASEINPMVLADSAGTCMHQLGKKGSARNAFCFPFTDRQTFITTANVHTANFSPDKRVFTQFYFIRSNDEEGKPIDYVADTYNVFTFGFKIAFKPDPQAQPVIAEWQVPFSSDGPSSGPSVPYLGEIIGTIRRSYYQNPTNTPGMIAAFKAANPEPSLGSIMNITTQIGEMMEFLQQAGLTTGHICLFVERLAMDVKKCGDWEQIKSVSASMNTCPTEVGTAMMCTGDYLCSTKARLDGLNGVWHNEGPGGATGWKLQLFRSPDLSDPNMAESINIVDMAKQVLPILHFTSKAGPHKIFERLNILSDQTKHAVELYRGKVGDPPPLVPGEDPIPAEYTAFTDIFATLCLASVCNSASTRSLILEKNEDLTRKIGDQLPMITASAIEAINDFPLAKQNDQLPQFIEKYKDVFSVWNEYTDEYSALLPNFINVLIDIGFSSEEISNLTKDEGDISDEQIDILICNADPQVIIDYDKLNPGFVCGDVFHYVYEWITIVGSKQGYLNSVIITEMKEAVNTLDIVMEQYGNKEAMQKDVVTSVRQIADAYNRVVNLLKTGNDFFKNTRGNASYKKSADRATNYDDIDLSVIAKNALLISIQVPPSLGRRGNELEDLIEKHKDIKESVNLFIQVSSVAANTLWRQLLPIFYSRIGLPRVRQVGSVGGKQKGGLGGPTDMRNIDVVDTREQEALKSYFDTIISTVIGYCRNATIQIDLDQDVTVDNYVNVLETFPLEIESAFNLARAAFLKGCLVDATANRLVYGPPTRVINTLQLYFESPIITKLTNYFKLTQDNIAYYYLPDLEPDMQEQVLQLVTNNSLEELAQKLANTLPQDPTTMATALVFMTIIGDIWGPSVVQIFENAYDNMYVSNVRRDIPETETLFGPVINFQGLLEYPYVAECVNKQIVLYNPAPGITIPYASSTFMKSQLADILFNKNPVARWASMGRFKIWAKSVSEDDDDGLIDMDDAGMAEDIMAEDIMAEDVIDESDSLDYEYPRFTSEEQFIEDVMNDLENAANAIINRDLSTINVSKLCFGIASVPNSYYGYDNPIITGERIDKAVEEANLLVAESIQHAQEQNQIELARQQQIQSQKEAEEYNKIILENLVKYALAFSQFYQMPTSLEQNATRAQEMLQYPAEQFSQTLPTMISVGAGKQRRTKKIRHRAKKTRGRKLKKKGTKRNRKKSKKTKSNH
ncbi:MAG: hypothetical protein CMB96_04625 [Flavobacteriaceae bacterium]|nr:hypothetical protein [Flavobacteriaceae bacterium]